MQHFILLRRDGRSIDAHSCPLYASVLLQVKVHVLPGPAPHPTWTSEEATGNRNHSPEDQEHRKGGYRDFAVRISAAGVAINVWKYYQGKQREPGHHDPRSGGGEVVQQFLQAQEVPGRFGRV